MLRFLTDEDFRTVIVRGVRRARPELNVVRAQDVGLMSAHDRQILEWAARDDRVVLTHDVTTMTRYAHERVRAGERMPGVVAVHQQAPLRVVIEDLILVVDCTGDEELEGQVRYVPL